MATPTTHLELHLQHDLGLLGARVNELGAKAARAVRRATAALLDFNTNEAHAVILRDRLLDRLEAEGERLGLELLVRHQPAGRNLRFIFASLRILRELERVGDCAESIARQTLALSQLDPRPALPPFSEQVVMATQMLDRALAAYRDQDEQAARQLIPVENAADQLREQISSGLLERHQHEPLSARALTTLLTVARRLERITDQAKHICEEVVFLTTGQPARHPHADALRVLFLDETQASLGHLAAAIARFQGGDDFAIHTAGLRPRPIPSATLEFLERKGIPSTDVQAHSLGEVPAPEECQLIVALSESAQIVFPMATARSLCLAWPMQEPTEHGDAASIQRGLEAAWQAIEHRLTPLLAAIRTE